MVYKKTTIKKMKLYKQGLEEHIDSPCRVKGCNKIRGLDEILKFGRELSRVNEWLTLNDAK